MLWSRVDTGRPQKAVLRASHSRTENIKDKGPKKGRMIPPIIAEKSPLENLEKEIMGQSSSHTATNGSKSLWGNPHRKGLQEFR